MRKKTLKKIIIIASIIVIALIIVLSTRGNKTEIHKLNLLYEKINTSQMYIFEMKQNDDAKTIIAKKDDKTLIDDMSKNSHNTTIVKDNNTYLVLHDREEYYVYEQNNVEQTILTDGLKEIVEKEYTTGKEKIKGREYSYEEYSGKTIFMISNSFDTSESDIKTRFYFDNENNLAYIRTIKGINYELLEINLKTEVEDSFFEVPSTYAEN